MIASDLRACRGNTNLLYTCLMVVGLVMRYADAVLETDKRHFYIYFCIYDHLSKLKL